MEEACATVYQSDRSVISQRLQMRRRPVQLYFHGRTSRPVWIRPLDCRFPIWRDFGCEYFARIQFIRFSCFSVRRINSLVCALYVTYVCSSCVAYAVLSYIHSSISTALFYIYSSVISPSVCDAVVSYIHSILS